MASCEVGTIGARAGGEHIVSVASIDIHEHVFRRRCRKRGCTTGRRHRNCSDVVHRSWRARRYELRSSKDETWQAARQISRVGKQWCGTESIWPFRRLQSRGCGLACGQAETLATSSRGGGLMCFAL